MDKTLFLPHFEKIDRDEKMIRMRTLAEQYGLLFKGLQPFSRWGQGCTTGVFEKDGRELVFVPGNTITLGWEQFSEGLDENNLAELNYIFGEYEYRGTPEDFIREDMAPVRQVTISPMLAGRELEEIGWEPVDFQDSRLLEHPDWLKEFEDHKRSGMRGLNLVGHARFDYIDGQWRAYLYHDVTYPQLKELLHRQGYSLPTADEWAYLCGGGCRTLFPWGDGLRSDMHLLHFESPESENEPYDMEEPNFFGLSIAYDPYMREVVEADTFTTCGGDGGCNICGGMGPLLGFLPCSPHRKPEVQEDDMLDIDFDFCRPIIRVGS
ncbi:MAG: hypothetical protein HFI38_07045 [Lachnospiraceae bacterium]|nr:hypothetical protein [Lachnospiraceae bacterium]